MKRYFLLLLLFPFATALAQLPPQLPPQLPVQTPPSPEAYEMTKYGDLPINEFTGSVSATIPIYTLVAGQLSLPISLNYKGAGVKVDQAPTWTGINWTLSAGGVIARTINDDADEFADGRLSLHSLDTLDLYYGSPDAEMLNQLFAVSLFHYDKRPDLFSFSFAGYAGTFYLDENFTPRLSKIDSALKIEIVGGDPDLKTRLITNKEFRITTPDGVRYYFGGEQVERTINTSIGHEFGYTPMTGYYLYKIEHPLHGLITLEYDTDPVSIINISRFESVNVVTKPYDNFFPNCSVGKEVSTMPVEVSSMTKTYDAKILKKIVSYTNGIEVSFNKALGSDGNYNSSLTSIVVKKGSTILRNVDFTYEFDFPSKSRFFLKKVEFDKHITGEPAGKYETYEMQYDDLQALPDRMSKSQDFAGYYNGASNVTLLPQTDNILFNATGNRDSDFEFARKGTLQKLKYPTGGYTQFEYEPIMAKTDKKTIRSFSIWRNDTSLVTPTQLTAGVVIGELIPIGQTGNPGVTGNQTMKVNVSLTAHVQLSHQEKFYVKVWDNNTNSLLAENVFFMPGASTPVGGGDIVINRVFSYALLDGHQYTLTLYYDNPTSPGTDFFKVSGSTSFISGFELVEQGGVRIKRVSDWESEGVRSSVKRLYYMPVDDVGKNIFDVVDYKAKPLSIEEHYITKCCNTEAFGVATDDSSYLTLVSSGFNPEVIDRDYQYVTTSLGGDDFEIGGYERKYTVREDVGCASFIQFDRSPFVSQRNSIKGNRGEIYNGAILRETRIEKRNAALYKSSVKIFQYSYLNQHSTEGIVGGEAYEECMLPTRGVDNYDLAYYGLFSSRAELLQTINTDYITPVPWGQPDTGYDKIVVTTNYQYGIYPGLATRIETITPTETSAVENTYPQSGLSLPGLTSTQNGAYGTLSAQHRVANPVQVENSKNGTPLFGKRTVYKVFQNGSTSRVLPELEQHRKGTLAYEDRINFVQYNTNGMLTAASLKNGPKVLFGYDAYDKLLYKMENYTGAVTSELVNWNDNPLSGVPGPTPSNPCGYQSVFQNSMLSTFQYDPVTDLLIRVTDANCRNTYYEYDAFDRLVKILDDDQLPIKQFNYNFRHANP